MSRAGSVRIVTEMLGEACTWRLLGLLLSRPTEATRASVVASIDELRDPELAVLARNWCDGATEGAYLALLGPGGLVSPRLASYRGFADPGWLLADLARYHESFGFHPHSEEPPDHVAVLAELVAYLWLKEAYARETGSTAAASLTQQARERLITEYLAPLGAPLAERLTRCGATAWAAAAQQLANRVPPPPPEVPGIGNSDGGFDCDACRPS